MRWHIGTSGWSYKHWRGPFYPQDLPQREWFAYYAARFETVELNNSFYHQPSVTTWREWRRAAPPGFCYAVKANRFLTHMKRFLDTGDSLKRFLDGARELQPHLGPLLYQAPPTFGRNETNAERLGAFLAALPESLQHVVEFRDKSWFEEETLAMLREHGVALCIQDMRGVESPVAATTSFVYLRLHGPGGAYQGSYDDEALRRWASRLEDLGCDEAWVYFNNDQAGYAPRNAARLRELVGG